MRNPNPNAYEWYQRGCRMKGLSPLTPTEFWADYRRYLRYDYFIRHYLQWRSVRSVSLPKHRRILQTLQKVFPIFSQLSHIHEAVEAGKPNGDDRFGDQGEAGVRTGPRTPVLVGAGARLQPLLDPEPAWRDP